MGYAETLKTISRRDFFRFALAATGMVTVAVVSKVFQDQDPIVRTRDCLQAQFSQAGLAIKKGLRKMENTQAALDPVFAQKIKFSISELRGSKNDDDETKSMRENLAVKGVVKMLNETAEPEKLAILVNYALNIFKETGLTQSELENLPDQQAAYVLLETAKRAKDIYLRCF